MTVGAGPVVGAPAGTMGVGGVDVLVEVPPEAPAVSLGWTGFDGAVWPSASTMGVDLPPAPPAPPAPLSADSELCDGGQSTLVGGQLSPPPPEPEESSPGGGQPEPAPKSPAPVQSALAGPATSTAVGHSTSTLTPTAAAACLTNVLDRLTARGYPRRR
jgi:hypothetical protein